MDHEKLECAEENLPKEETEFLSTHSQMTNLQDTGNFDYTPQCGIFMPTVQYLLFKNLRQPWAFHCTRSRLSFPILKVKSLESSLSSLPNFLHFVILNCFQLKDIKKVDLGVL